MKQYLDLLQHVRDNGTLREDRTGTGTLSVFGHQMRFDLAQGFPLLTTKRVHYRAVVHELLWMLRGSTNIGYLKQQNVRIWDEWATAEGELGPVYGAQWRSWPTSTGETIDQISQVIERIKVKPNCRRLIVSAWNPEFLPDDSIPPHENAAKGKMALPPCHTLFQFYVSEGKLSCQLYMRSADIFLGLPFNIASYATLIHMMASVTTLRVGELIVTLGDAHIYLNHLTQVNEQLSREPLPLPTLEVNPFESNIFNFLYEDIDLRGYLPYPAISAPISV